METVTRISHSPVITQQDPSDEPGPRSSQKVKPVSKDEGENQGTIVGVAQLQHCCRVVQAAAKHRSLRFKATPK